MAWTAKQKSLAVRACKAAGVSEQQRTDVILRNFANAEYGGDITSTSPKLTNHDFEQFMAIVESHAGGRLMSFERGHWQRAAADRWQRMRHRCQQMADQLQAAGHFSADSLAGWIAKRVTNGRADQLDQLDFDGLRALSLQLASFCRQRGVATPAERRTA